MKQQHPSEECQKQWADTCVAVQRARLDVQAAYVNLAAARRALEDARRLCRALSKPLVGDIEVLTGPPTREIPG